MGRYPLCVPLLSIMMLAQLAPTAAAMSLRDVRATLPAPFAHAEQPALVASDAAGPRNVGLLAGVPGAYVASSAAVRADDGAPLPDAPDLVAGASPDGGALVAPGWPRLVALPGPATGRVWVGASLFQSIAVRLAGRARSAPQPFAGGAFYPDVRPGLSELAFVQPDGVETWLVVERAQAGLTFRFDVTLPWRARLVDRDGQVAIDSPSGELVRISAPLAVDAAGSEHAVSIRAAGASSFELSVDADADAISFPLAVDPRFMITGFDVPGEGRFYELLTCGGQANNRLDFSPGSDVYVFDACNAAFPNLSGAVVTSGGTRFLYPSSPSRGLGVELRDSFSYRRREQAWVELAAPQGAGIVSSNFRGHIYATDGSITCELQYGRRQIRDSLIESPDPENRRRLFAGFPLGVGTAPQWATFPLGYPDVGDTTLNGPTGLRHMRGFFSMRFPDSPSSPLWRRILDIDNQADWIRLTLRVNDRLRTGPADSSHRCNADGIWNVVLFDPDPPTVTAPDLSDLDTPGAWFSPQHTDRLNDPGNAIGTAARRFAAHDPGSGLRSVEMWVDTDPGTPPLAGKRRVKHPCLDSENHEVDDIERTILGDDDDHRTPCPSPYRNSFADPIPLTPPLTDIAPTTRGEHRIQFSAVDFVKLRGNSKPARYRVDDQDPTCTVTSAVTGTSAVLTVAYSDPGFAASPRTGAGVRSLTLQVNGGVVAWPLTDAGTAVVALRGGGSFTTQPLDLTQFGGGGQIGVVVEDFTRTSADGLSAPHAFTCSPPVTAFNVDAVRGAGGVAGVWNDVAGAGSYNWQCVDAASTVLESGMVTDVAGTGTYSSALCDAAPGAQVTVTVTAQAGATAVASGSDSESVDRRPTVATGIDPDGGNDRYDSLNGPTYINGSRSRNVVVDVADPDANLLAPSTPDGRLAGLAERPSPDPAAGDTARLVVAVIDDNGDATSDDVRVLWTLNAGTGQMQVMLDERPFLTNPLADALEPAVSCMPGTGSITGTRWTINCTALGVDTSSVVNGLRLTLPLRPLATTIDQRYQVSGYLRDQRQAADNRYLTAVSGLPDAGLEAGNATGHGTLTLDRHLPSLQVTASGSGFFQNARFATVSAAVRDIAPGEDTTDPATLDATGVSTALATVEQWTGTQWQLVGTANEPMSCTPALPTVGVQQSTCTRTIPANAFTRYRFTITTTDLAGNTTSVVRDDACATLSAGSIDPLFGTNGYAQPAPAIEGRAEDLVQDQNGMIVSAGWNNLANTGFLQPIVTRHTLAGQVDAAFGTGGVATIPQSVSSQAEALAIDAAGRILVTGITLPPSGSVSIWVARLLPNGSLDTSFGTSGVVTLFPGQASVGHSVAFSTTDGRIYVAGQRGTQFVVVGLTNAGQLDASYGIGGVAVAAPLREAFDLAIDSSGRVVAGGTAVAGPTGSDYAVARFTTTGTPDFTFALTGSIRIPISAGNLPDDAFALAIQSDGKIVGVGRAGSFPSAFGTVRLNPTGTLDTTFNGTGIAITNVGLASAGELALDVIADPVTNTITVAGNSFGALPNPAPGTTNGIRMTILRYLNNGTLDTTFGTGGIAVAGIGGASDAYGLILASNGEYIVSGRASLVGLPLGIGTYTLAAICRGV